MSGWGKRERAPKLVAGAAPAGPLAGLSFEVHTRPADGSKHARRCSRVTGTATTEVITLGGGPTLDDLGWPADLHCAPELGFAPLSGEDIESLPTIGHPSTVRGYGQYGEDLDDDVVAVHGRAYLRRDVVDLDDYARRAVEASEIREQNDAKLNLRRTLPGKDSAWNLRWKDAARALASSRRMWGRTDTYPLLQEFDDDTRARHDMNRNRLREEIALAGFAVLRSGRLAEATAAEAALDDYHHAGGGERFRLLRDSAISALETPRSSHSGPPHWQVSNALNNVLFAGGQQGFPFQWLAHVADDPDSADDVGIVIRFAERGSWDYTLRNGADRRLMLTLDAFHVLGRVTAAYRAQLVRIAVTSPVLLVLRSTDLRGDWARVVRAAVPSRIVHASPGGGRKDPNRCEIAAIPEHALRGYEDTTFILAEVTESAAAAEVDRVADLAEGDPDVQRELEAHGVTAALAHRVTFRAGLPRPNDYGPRHKFW